MAASRSSSSEAVVWCLTCACLNTLLLSGVVSWSGWLSVRGCHLEWLVVCQGLSSGVAGCLLSLGVAGCLLSLGVAGCLLTLGVAGYLSGAVSWSGWLSVGCLAACAALTSSAAMSFMYVLAHERQVYRLFVTKTHSWYTGSYVQVPCILLVHFIHFNVLSLFSISHT